MKNSKNIKTVLFVSEELSRELILLARNLSRTGVRVLLATPASENEKFLLDVPHIRIRKLSFFKKTFLFATKRFKSAILSGATVHALDAPSVRLAKSCATGGKIYYAPLDFGIDLNIWTPDAVSIPRQTRLLAEYNIAPHQKLITVISPLGSGLVDILRALGKIGRDDLVIALAGKAKKVKAKRIVRAVQQSGQAGRIVYIGEAQDLTTVMRASFATISVSDHNRRMLKFATAMGRPTIWDAHADIPANIEIHSAGADAIADAIIRALDISAKKRDQFEQCNLDAARAFSIAHTLDFCLGLYAGK